ncbi:hypothetical protein L5515_002430 [Caenorhabditis briggsae]|uniref:Uncharacterized protein n=1 Tax=Caenorhabditis briggsae TaxID=6238 RepID=A0AAE9DZX1_CAEBR|nr:hypothetical protein L3Y34_016364 [Caenorhabditis briggsae]UMM14741.1 hypothetical protein L5515_002430 [Caenorhabditis briggsae]
MDEFLDNVDLKEVRRKIYVFCHLFILGWTICHVWASYQVFGVILFIILFLAFFWITVENTAIEKLEFGQRFLIVFLLITFVLYYGGLYMIPIAVVLVIMLVGLEILYNALGEMQEKIQRLEKDVGELHDAQMAPEYDEEEEIREREMERAVRILRNVARMRSV